MSHIRQASTSRRTQELEQVRAVHRFYQYLHVIEEAQVRRFMRLSKLMNLG